MAVFLFVVPFPSSAGLRTGLCLVALAALFFLFLARREFADFGALPRPFRVATAIWIAICVASVAWTVKGWYTAEELRRQLLYDAMAFVMVYGAMRSMRDARIAVVAIIAGTLLMGTFEWIRHFMPDSRYAARYESAQGSFSTQIALVAPLLAFAAWPSPAGLGWRPRTLALLAIALVAAGLATENRMLWLALASGCVVAFAVFQAGAAPDAQRARMLRVLLGTLSLIALAIAATWEYKAAHYYSEATAMESLSMDERPRVWSAASALAQQRPLLGHGYGREIVGDAMERAVPTRDKVRIRHGHNVFIDTVLQLGFIGLAAFVAMLASLVHAYARTRHTAAGAPIAITGLAMMATFVVKDLTDDFFVRPSSVTFWAVNAMLLALATPRIAAGREPGAAGR